VPFYVLIKSKVMLKRAVPPPENREMRLPRNAFKSPVFAQRGTYRRGGPDAWNSPAVGVLIMLSCTLTWTVNIVFVEGREPRRREKRECCIPGKLARRQFDFPRCDAGN